MDEKYGASLQIVDRLLKGKDPMVPPFTMGVVDVKDVARLHVAALTAPISIGQRYSAVAGTLSMKEMSLLLKEWDPTLNSPTKEMPVWLLKILSPFMPELKTVLKSTNRNLTVPGAKAEKDFGFTFIPPKQALLESAQAIRP